MYIRPDCYYEDPNFWNKVILILIGAIIILTILIGIARAEEPLRASWYSFASLKTEGTWSKGEQRMANGQWFDENALTCATRLYPFGTFLCITNLNNGKSVIVRVTDRISKRFAKSRIDLSKKAFQQIADLKQGIVPIKVEER